MKKVLIFSTLVLAIVISGCGGSDSSNNPPTPSVTTIEYEFTLIIDGVVNKVKGNLGSQGISLNGVMVGLSPLSSAVRMSIGDITSSDYVSGHPFVLNLNFEKNILGKVRACIQFDGSGSSVYRDKYISPFLNDLGQPSYRLGLYSDTSKFRNMTAFEYSTVFINAMGLGPPQILDPGFDLMSSDIQITDLGTAGIGGTFPGDKPLKGYMPKTKLFYPIEIIATGSSPTGPTWSVNKWSPPVELEFSFKAIRYN
jgi:hypothetical protein